MKKHWTQRTKQEWIDCADVVEIMDDDKLLSHPNKWIRRLAPAVIKIWGFYVYFQEGKTYLILPVEKSNADYQIFQTAAK